MKLANKSLINCDNSYYVINDFIKIMTSGPRKIDVILAEQRCSIHIRVIANTLSRQKITPMLDNKMYIEVCFHNMFKQIEIIKKGNPYRH